MTELGTVQDVSINDEREGIFVDVGISPRRNRSGIRFAMPGGNMWSIPEPGDVVEISEVDGVKVARFPHNSNEFSPPSNLSEGDFAVKVNENSYLHLQKQSDGTVNLRLDVDGDIFIGDESNANKVADENHTHTFTTSDGASGTTDPPSTGDLTETEVE
jgi:hypothetical protein